ncbi:MAG TPA: queuosine precursor transporter [Rhizomicrobium sp.]
MKDKSSQSSLLPLITAVFVTILVLTPSTSSKFITLGTIQLGSWHVGPLNVVGATLFFPINYLFNDILTEVYGYERSRRIIWIGLACQLFAAAMYALIQYWPAASFWHNEAAYDAILGQAPRIVAGSLCAYFVGEFVNSFVLSKLKYWANGGNVLRVAFRFVASTFVGEFFDSFIFLTISFYGQMANTVLIETIITIWLLKALYEVVALPVSLPLTAWIKRRESIDHIDHPEATNYSPFRL